MTQNMVNTLKPFNTSKPPTGDDAKSFSLLDIGENAWKKSRMARIHLYNYISDQPTKKKIE
jgi:hypothetical protein